MSTARLLRLAYEERETLGYITDPTRTALHSGGLTSYEIESALAKMVPTEKPSND